ncbi:MAG: ABC transporter substrate-binding protein, partial [Vicinamibacterales bacterium]
MQPAVANAVVNGSARDAQQLCGMVQRNAATDTMLDADSGNTLSHHHLSSLPMHPVSAWRMPEKETRSRDDPKLLPVQTLSAGLRLDKVSSVPWSQAKNLAKRPNIAAEFSKLHANSKLSRFAALFFHRTVSWPAGQLLTGLARRLVLSIVVVASCAIGFAACRSDKTSTPSNPAASNGAVPRGGQLLVSVRSEPRSFNRHAARDTTTNLVSNLTQGRLIRVNQTTQAVEPWLAESWTTGDQGRRVTLTLKRDVAFSDGHPFTSDDVLFAFEATYDEKNGSVLADSIQAGGKKLRVTAADPYTVVITFPEPFAPGIRILDNLPILPRHKLEAALKAGTFTKAWGLDTPPSDVVGLGPFVLSEYVPGQRVVFARNPRYSGKAPDGAPLPYLDRLVVEIIPDQSAELLRLESGQLDMMTSEISPEAYAPLKRAADEGRVKLLDLGVSRNANGLWFNLKAGALGQDPRAAWL